MSDVQTCPICKKRLCMIQYGEAHALCLEPKEYATGVLKS